ncbi:ectoine hydroxylase [Paramicrobacterium agarici]|uniref:Ectoine hydroxylase n=1 Tax=Paramicrobacterium agarici TaxID=630514 RepID=A0A2A9DSM1_9MICO|nr:ectoine hydroxylase [Microbacterium agarici]PFG29584.1 ectoine hydroxylase [Microbacterium agarici]TQO22589.1 ectoine hydroxylase [Microbacterium agarici]
MTATQTVQTDVYPTRTGGAERVLDREDPTLYGTADDGPMDAATLSGYDRNGYLAIDELISADEVAALTAELQRLSADEGVRRDERTIVEAASDEVRSIFEIHKVSDVFAKIANDPRVVGRAKQLLGSDVYIHQSRVNFKPGFEGKEFMWHSDFETWHAEDGLPNMRTVSISISLTDNYSYNGPLMIMPGSHKKYVSCAGETPEDNYKKSLIMQGAGTPEKETLTAFADEYGIDVLEGKSGGAIMFDCNCMHASNGNVTPYPRSNVFIVFNSVENTAVEPFSTSSPRPEFAGARDFTPAG